ncbi:protein artichoke-like [Liolophura sinensis]|uniref:protein artichoke-like n=1 Tax=Liolophura sinensis TaxID=3198878 RepID=UPI00315957E3
MGGLHYGLLVTLVSLVVLPEEGLGQCPVDPRCTCQPRNNSDITCNNVFTGELPTLLPPDDVYFRSLTVYGYGINSIAKGAFKKLPVTRLTLSGIRISELECQGFAGLENSLTQLLVNNTRLTSIPICAIESLKKLTSFTLNGSRIPTLRPDDFSNITLLESLRLTSNYIEKIEPGAFRALVHLTDLSLDANKITGLDDLPFRGLTSLKTLSLQNNGITSLPVRLFDELINLQHLYVDYNDIVELEKTLFSRNPNLSTISLLRNQLSSLPEKIFKGLDKLQTLVASYNRLSDLPLKLFEGCPNLNSLDLSSNMLTYLKPELLRPLTKLKTINLRNNRISGISDNLMNVVMTDAFSQSASIAYIYLQNNSLSTIQPGAFRNLISLRNLGLSQNKLTAIPPGALTNSSSLQYLYLDNNQIRDIPRDFFEQLSSRIYTLYLDNNHLLTSSIVPLFERLPKWTGLRTLRLSDTKLPPLSADVFTAFGRLSTELSLRNCSLNGEFPVNRASLPGKKDLSNNNLKGFNKNTQVKVIGSPVTFNISNNALETLDVNASSGQWIYIYADNNNIRNLTVTGRNTVNGARLEMSENLISSPIRITTNVTRIYLLDLSSNRFTSVESPPVNFTQSLDPCALRNVSTLNLSRNAIQVFSPDACLGGVLTLDLSHNQLQTLGALIPLRYTPVGHKIDHARCHSPPDKELLLVQCYNVTDCEANRTSVSVSYSIPTVCKEDSAIVLRDVTTDTAGDDVVIHWSVHGPGAITGFRLTYREDAGSDDDKENLYHPEKRSAVLFDLESGHSYNVCIWAEVYPDSRTEPVCMHVDGVVNIHVEIMALGIALGVSVLIIIVLVACLIVKSKRDVNNKPGETVVRRGNLYNHAQREVGNTPGVDSMYENID